MEKIDAWSLTSHRFIDCFDQYRLATSKNKKLHVVQMFLGHPELSENLTWCACDVANMQLLCAEDYILGGTEGVTTCKHCFDSVLMSWSIEALLRHADLERLNYNSWRKD